MRLIKPVLITFLSIVILSSSAFAKIGNSVEQNKADYGKEVNVDSFSDSSSESNYTGYRKYSLKDWEITAFFLNGKVRSEHLTPKRKDTLSRDEVRDWALRMFPQTLRGVYKQELKQVRAEGHFFDKGLIAYEYNIVNGKIKDYCGVKVLLYEDNKSFWQINPKAFL